MGDEIHSEHPGTLEAQNSVSGLSLLIVWLLTDEGGRRQFALVHAVDRAEGAHDATYSEAVEHLPRLDQRFACMAARKFTVCLQRRGKTGIFRLYRFTSLQNFCTLRQKVTEQV